MKPVFDKNGLASEAGYIRCFYYDTVTREYTGWSDEFINTGVSMPGDSTDIDPGQDIDDMVAVFNETGWEYLEDNRGDTVYSTENGKPSIVDYIGSVRNGYTSIPPSTPYDKWNGSEWETDAKAQHEAAVAEAEQTKTALMAEATEVIAPLADAQAGGYIDDADVPRLAEWQRYRYQLTKLDTSTAPNINLPPRPEV
ncbi:tail fiber assembly protein [Salmonella enterica]|uniref:tail fiber assembly protein n=1 Tax=Salmonella enterica TaxID=28901 RepID=UPI000FB14EE7|nr:tail fiber assembly protein [Salmonella enterica subsp. enterica serovar Thompson]EEO5414710.1 tail fiber assembly protein [Salmonella enterica subsp. enterica serovar Thompson]EFV2496303.1 tail fiber assembly protein [Salmonella enterica]MJX35933.1 tail fiber assembly protein [Salmonella enterica subsp. enterica serovar Braenderup]